MALRVFSTAALIALAACAVPELEGGEPGPGASSSPSRATAGLWPADRTRLIASSSGGGFAPPPPRGSTCTAGATTYEVDLAARTLAWTACPDVGAATVLVVRGERALSGAAIAAIDSAMNDVGVAERAMCGADKPLLSLDVTSASQGTKRFADGFYSCLGGDAVYVDRVDAVFAALDALTVAAD